nr:hypothetical protein [Tanacetum cinerariifolium]
MDGSSISNPYIIVDIDVDDHPYFPPLVTQSDEKYAEQLQLHENSLLRFQKVVCVALSLSFVRVALSLSYELRVRAEQLYRAARSGVKHYI